MEEILCRVITIDKYTRLPTSVEFDQPCSNCGRHHVHGYGSTPLRVPHCPGPRPPAYRLVMPADIAELARQMRKAKRVKSPWARKAYAKRLAERDADAMRALEARAVAFWRFKNLTAAV